MPVSRLACVIGWPVNRSLSPLIHNAAFAALGLPWSFSPVAIRPNALAEGMALLDTLEASGVSVTMPHKRSVIEYCAELSEEATRLDAVNTLTRRPDGRWEGHNTDAEGFTTFLRKDAGLSPAKALVVGAGGAARAVVVAMADAGIEVVVTSRDPAQAEAVAALAPGTTCAPWGKRVAADLIVQSTPVRDDSLPEPYRTFPKGRAAIDLTYGQPTAFLDAARSAGVPAFDGVGMLIRQAALAFHRWTGQDAPIAVMRDAVETDIAARK